jgi:hypothetical protein
MRVESAWLIKEHVVLTHLGDFDIPELAEMAQEMATYQATTSATHLHQIVDVRDLRHFPANVNVLRQHLSYWQHPKMGYIIALGINNPIVSFLAQILPKMIGVKFHKVDTLDEAIQYLQKMDSNLVGLEIEQFN